MTTQNKIAARGHLEGFIATPSQCVPVDKETGCNQCTESAQQSCRQAYFLKQQNQILTEQKNNTELQKENIELKNQIDNIQPPAQSQVPTLFYASILVSVVLITFLITQFSIKK